MIYNGDSNALCIFLLDSWNSIKQKMKCLIFQNRNDDEPPKKRKKSSCLYCEQGEGKGKDALCFCDRCYRKLHDKCHIEACNNKSLYWLMNLVFCVDCQHSCLGSIRKIWIPSPIIKVD